MSENNFGNGTPVPPPQWTPPQPPLAQPPYAMPGNAAYPSSPQPGPNPYAGPQSSIPPNPYATPQVSNLPNPYTNPAGYYAQPPPPQSNNLKPWIWIVVAVVVIAIVAAITYAVTKPSSSPTQTAAASSAPATSSAPGTSSAPATSAAPTSQAGTRVNINSAEVGDCFDTTTMEADDYMYIRPLDCATSHDGEIFFVGRVDSPTYPTYPDGWRDFVADLCFPAFSDYVGDPYYESDLNLDYVYPLEVNWNNGDHTLICFVYADAPSTTPLQGSGR